MTYKEDELWELHEKLDTIIRLLAANIGTTLPVAERAPVLNRLGLDRGTIASVCNTTPAAVSVRLAEAKRKPSKIGNKRKTSGGKRG